jgi:Ca2+-binding EF-hand superfamily protein
VQENLKMSEIVAKPLRKFWAVMVTESEALGRQNGNNVAGRVTREGYEQMHLRVSKSLSVGFNLQAAKDSANQDWAEDITAFSGDTGVSIWLEEVKKKFKTAVELTVKGEADWEQLFRAYDEDGSGEMEFEEFEAAVRGECNIAEGVVSEGELRELFGAVDKDSSGDIDLREFVDFLESDPLAADMTFKVFSEAMQQLAQLWVGKAEEEQYAKFLGTIFENITEKDGRLRGLVTDGEDYRLAPLDAVDSMVSQEDHKVQIAGVDMNDIHSVSGQTPAELEAARRRAEEEEANRALEEAKRQAAADAAMRARARLELEAERERRENEVMRMAAEEEGSQSPLSAEVRAEIARRQKMQREQVRKRMLIFCAI